jgi:hypothetical protein
MLVVYCGSVMKLVWNKYLDVARNKKEAIRSLLVLNVHNSFISTCSQLDKVRDIKFV